MLTPYETDNSSTFSDDECPKGLTDEHFRRFDLAESKLRDFREYIYYQNVTNSLSQAGLFLILRDLDAERWEIHTSLPQGDQNLSNFSGGEPNFSAGETDSYCEAVNQFHNGTTRYKNLALPDSTFKDLVMGAQLIGGIVTRLDGSKVATLWSTTYAIMDSSSYFQTSQWERSDDWNHNDKGLLVLQASADNLTEQANSALKSFAYSPLMGVYVNYGESLSESVFRQVMKDKGL